MPDESSSRPAADEQPAITAPASPAADEYLAATTPADPEADEQLAAMMPASPPAGEYLAATAPADPEVDEQLPAMAPASPSADDQLPAPAHVGTPPRPGFFGLIRRRLASCWRLKIVLSIAMAVLFCVPYFLLGNYPLFPVHEIPPSQLDVAIGFHPQGWIWIYQSVYLIVNLIPWLADRPAHLYRFARGYFALAAISFTIFLFFPTRIPRPPVLHPSPMYRLLLQYDAKLNALPSLHAGLLVYVLGFGRRILRDTRTSHSAASASRMVYLRPPRTVRSAEATRRSRLYSAMTGMFIAWGVLILCATLATKEHYVLDILAGTLLALAVDAWTWRKPAA